MTGIVVREADPTDSQHAAAIVAILDAHARTAESLGEPLADALKSSLVATLREHNDAVVLLAFAGAIPVGVAVCLGSEPGMLRLHDVAVTTKYDGVRSDVATLLMKTAETLASARSGPTSASSRAGLWPRVGVDVLRDWDVSLGGAVTPDRYLAGIRDGVFLLSVADIRWWCGPTRRAVFPLDGARWPGTVRRAMLRPRFRVTIDQAFVEVVRACADRHGQSTWIADDVIGVQVALHERGLAHSVEVWNTDSNLLVGGIFGVAVGGMFAGDSMFHRETDASKVAFAALAECLRAARFRLFDVQLMTAHLASLGCIEIPRAQYLGELAAAVDLPRPFPTLLPSAVVRP